MVASVEPVTPVTGDRIGTPHRGRRHPVLAFVARRLLAAVLTLLAASILIYLAASVLPGNAAEVLLGRNASPAAVHHLKVELGLNRPLVDRYLSWLGGAVSGDFGRSAVAVAEGRPDSAIAATLGRPLFNSAVLALITALLLVPLTLLFGMTAGVFAGRRLDYAISVPSLVFGGLPEFVSGTALIFLFFTVLGALPPVALLGATGSPFSYLNQLVLPVLTLLAVALGAGIRQVRSGMIDVLQEDFIRFARLNGVTDSRILLRYALRNALAPSVQIIAQNLQYLVGGIIIVESVFAYPGIGTYLVNAVQARDVGEVQAAAIILAAIYIVINIIADLVVVLLVPKLRTEL